MALQSVYMHDWCGGQILSVLLGLLILPNGKSILGSHKYTEWKSKSSEHERHIRFVDHYSPVFVMNVYRLAGW